jgi:Domain of unknown function (DUF4416)
MLEFQSPLKVKFISGFIFRDEDVYIKTKAALEKKFGAIDFESEPIAFNFTDYYEKEMGKNLIRRFVAFKKLQDPGLFIPIKQFCVRLERKFALRHARRINIDPGYINESKLVLTTTKDFSHRIYLGHGVFAEITLNYRGKSFQDQETTFPDYRTDTYKNIFLKIRESYRTQIADAKQ